MGSPRSRHPLTFSASSHEAHFGGPESATLAGAAPAPAGHSSCCGIVTQGRAGGEHDPRFVAIRQRDEAFAVEAAHHLVDTHPRADGSLLLTSPGGDTLGAAMVFHEKKTTGLRYNSGTDCPVDAGERELENEPGVGGTACAGCMRCFNDKRIDLQRELLRAWRAEHPEPAGRRVALPLADVGGQGHPDCGVLETHKCGGCQWSGCP